MLHSIFEKLPLQAFISISVLAGALGFMQPVQAQPQIQTLSIAFADPISSLDPQLNNHAGDRSAALHVWDSIINSRDGSRLEPALASSWRQVDELTWEFKLRDDIQWQDGVPFTADDILFSFQRAPQVPGSVAPYKGALRSVESVTAPDPYTVVLTTKSPNPNLPLEIASIYIVSKHIGESAKTEDYNLGKANIGTGPYKVVSYTPGDRVIYERSDSYYGDAPEWKKVVYRHIGNPAARTAALLAGDVDVIDKVSVTDLEKLQASDQVDVFTYPGLRVLTLQPSFRDAPNEYITDHAGNPLKTNPLRDVRVRQALSLAINRDALADRLLQKTVTVANQWMPAGTFGYNPDVQNIPHDVEQAKQLLAQAGYPDGFQIVIHVPSDRHPQAPEAMQAIAQFWARIGVKTTVDVVPGAIYAANARKNEYAISVIAWGNGTGEASYGLLNILATVDPERGRGASNWGHYSNPEIDVALDKASQEFDAQAREKILQHAAAVVSEDVGIIPLFHYKNIWAAQKGLVVVPLLSDRTTALQVHRQP